MRKGTILLIAAGLLFVIPATAHALTGAIFTTLENGSRVNANIYQAQENVYLDGGPGQNAPSDAAGLLEGDYYFQVTDPSGKVLLSTDLVKCRKFRVNSYGVIGQVYSAVCSEKIKGKPVDVECTHNFGIDLDHSELGAITVQLMPYARTPNSGGVYKVWVTPVASFSGNPELIDNGYSPGNYHGFIPKFCKTDVFKVLRGKPFNPPILEVRKFHDLNANGSRDSGEPEITGWQIEITDPLGVANIYYTPVLTQAMPEGTWTIVEKVSEHWLQTALYIDNVSQTVGAEAQIQIAGASGETHLIVYGNIQTGDIIGCKWYDRNADGFQDSTEPGISNWLIELIGTGVNGSSVSLSGYTDSSGCIAFANLLPGSYTISEKIPLTGWFGSTPTSFAIDLVGGAIKTREFGNFCVSSADFDTKGYWHNKNGLDEISQTDIDYVNGLDPYDSDTEYWQSEPFDGSWTPLNPGEYFGTGAWAEISDYLVSPVISAPARFQLAQQLLAFAFNCLHRLDSPSAAIQLSDGSWETASELISQAISIWASGTSEEQTSIKDLFDLFNNDDSVPFICYNPCSVVYP